MLSGGGSYARSRQSDSDHMRRLKQAFMQERADQVARSRKLHSETIKRRRALALKRKTDAQREEQRRQSILAKRKEQIREATEKYQRLNKHYDPRQYNDIAANHASGPSLEEALRAIRGSSPRGSIRQGSASSFRQGSASSIRQGSASSLRQGSASSLRQGSASSLRQGSAGSLRQGSASLLQQDSTSSIRSNSGGVYAMGNSQYDYMVGQYDYANPRKNDYRTEHKEGSVASVSQLHNRSLTNLNTSRSLFEQQLEHQQSVLQEQQRKYMQDFNKAIQEEMDNDQKLAGEMDADHTFAPARNRTDSISSADSLEVEVDPKEATQNKLTHEQDCHTSDTSHLQYQPMNQYSAQNTRFDNSLPQKMTLVHSVPASSCVTSSSGHEVHRSINVSSPNVAVVHPSVLSSSAVPVSPYYANHITTTPKDHTMNHHEAKTENSPFPQASSAFSSASHPLKDTSSSSLAAETIYTNSNGRCNGHVYQDSVVSHMTTMDDDRDRRLFYEAPRSFGDKDNASACNPRTQDILSIGPSSTKAWTAPSPTVTSYSRSKHAFNRDQESVLHPYGKTTATATSIQSNGTALMNSSAQGEAPPKSQSSRPVYSATNRTATYSTSSFPVHRTVPTTSATSSYKTAEATPSNHYQNMLVANHPYAVSATPVSISNVKSVYSQPPVQPQVSSAKQPLTLPSPEDSPSPQQEEDSSSSSSGSEEEAPPQEKVIRGILKKKYMPRTNHPIKLTVQGRNTENMGKGGIRDSLEVNKDHLQRSTSGSLAKKKSVRFAEKLCEEQEEWASSYRPVPLSQPSTCSIINPKGAEASRDSVKPKAKPSRPISAQVTSSTPKVDPSVKNPRVASAGRMRRGPFLRPHPPSQPPSGRATMNAYQHNPKSLVRYQNNYTAATNTSESDPAASEHPGISVTVTTPGAAQEYNSTNNGDAAHDPSAFDLDKTPTDDEINQLWQNVRECLGKEGSAPNNTQEQREPAAVAQKYIDGNCLAPQFRVSTRVTNNYANNYMGSAYPPKKKVSIETLNAYNRRSTLLHQRKNQAGGTIVYPGTDDSSAQSTLHDLNSHKPQQSSAPPTNANGVYGADVSESMAAFLTAEMLTCQSASESQIEAAMRDAQLRQRAYNTSHPQPKAPSALSIEEQRLLQSLEKLNERLRIAENNAVPSSALVPKPPPQHGGFKGHAPISANGRRFVNNNGTVSRHNYRTNSHTNGNAQGMPLWTG